MRNLLQPSQGVAIASAAPRDRRGPQPMGLAGASRGTMSAASSGARRGPEGSVEHSKGKTYVWSNLFPRSRPAIVVN
jgi:hypothetical protein